MMRMVRVSWLKAPAPTVETPNCISARWASGTFHRYQAKQMGSSAKEGITHRELQRSSAVFNSGNFTPSIRAQVTRAHTPASEAHANMRKNRLGQNSGLKNAWTKRLDSIPVPATASQACP